MAPVYKQILLKTFQLGITGFIAATVPLTTLSSTLANTPISFETKAQDQGRKIPRYRIPARFYNGSQFSEGLAPVRIGKKYGFINKSGRLVIQANFEEV